jgi:hypothetical protein
MNPNELATADQQSTLARARVVDVLADGRVLVQADGLSGAVSLAERLTSSDAAPLKLAPGDAVLICSTRDAERSTVVIGRIGPTQAAEPAPATVDEPAISDELVLEAKHSLTLRVGEGSITIREDGKILIKGKDLVSHAQRMNRIKGGAVSIN